MNEIARYVEFRAVSLIFEDSPPKRFFVRVDDIVSVKEHTEDSCKISTRDGNTVSVYGSYDEIVQTIRDDDWISAKDRLPENDGLYIVCKTVHGHRISFEAHWKENKWLSVVKNNQLDYVTHWQPLPEPPKGE